MSRHIAILAGVLFLVSCGDETNRHASHSGASTTDPIETHERSERAIPGYAEVVLPPDRVQLFAVRTEPASRRALTRSIRTAGIVRTDETKESHVHLKWNGWIDEVFVAYIGQQVKKGEPLFRVYGPDILTGMQELLIAVRRARNNPQDATAAEALAAARMRLSLWDVPGDVIAEVEKSGKVDSFVTIRAPRDGTVIEKNVRLGMYVEPMMDLYTITNLSRVWVVADIYEYEIPRLSTGQTATFVPIGGTGEEITAPVTFIAPTVDPMTRTVKVRLEIENPRGSLRPGTYGIVRIDMHLPETLAVSADAVIDTGTRQIVFERVREGAFIPREVRLGARAGGFVQILAGIEEGAEVVTRAQFLLDSESRLRAAAGGGQPGHAGH